MPYEENMPEKFRTCIGMWIFKKSWAYSANSHRSTEIYKSFSFVCIVSVFLNIGKQMTGNNFFYRFHENHFCENCSINYKLFATYFAVSLP